MKNFIASKLAAQLDRLNGHNVQRLYRAACAHAKRNFARDYPLTHDFFERSVRDGCSRHFFSEWKFTELQCELERIRPSTIIEFGSGISTGVFAEYVKANPGAVLYSVDENADYQREVQNRLSAVLSQGVHFIHSPAKTRIEDGQRTCFYASSPPLMAVDLVYVDGPACSFDGCELPCVDVADLVRSRVDVGNILFDYRIQSVNYLLRTAVGSHFDFELAHLAHRQFYGTWFGSSARYHSRFWRR